MRTKLLRILRIAPLALLFASVASAQTTGTIIGVVTDASTGKPVAGALVIATSPNLQGQQTAVTEVNGSYRINLLPPGEYTLLVQLGGYKDAQRSDISIRLDKTIRANLAVVPEAVQMEEQVVRTGAAPVVNIGSAESGAVVSREFVENMPVGRTVEAVAAVVPTAQVDLYGTSFAGSQSVENAYILDGMNVGDPVYGAFGSNTTSTIAQPSLLTNFIQEVDVKTGGFMPEYGHATGGVLNMVTKSGSNEFHGSVFGNYTPSFLLEPNGPISGRAGEAVAYRLKPSEGAYNLDLGFDAGGPIMKDKLWFYAGFAPVITRRTTDRFLRTNVLQSDAGAVCDPGATAKDAGYDKLGRCKVDGNFVQNAIPGSDQLYRTGRTTYQAVGKLTYLLDENNNFTLSSYGMPSKVSDFAANGTESTRLYDTTDNIFDMIGRYSGRFLDKRLVLEAVAGYHQSSSKADPTAYQQNTPVVRFRDQLAVSLWEDVPGCDATTDAGKARCTVQRYRMGGYGYGEDLSANRLSGRISAAYLFDALGSHNTKVGLDAERSNFTLSKFYSGGGFYDVYQDYDPTAINRVRGFGRVTNAIYPGFAANTSSFETWTGLDTDAYTVNTALFAQDSWQLPVANVTVNYGLRWESQSMQNTTTHYKGFDITNNFAPRVQAIWDFTGNGRGKVAANWGRFFYPIPLDMGGRAFGGEVSVGYGMPLTCGGLGQAIKGGSLRSYDPNSVKNYATDPACAPADPVDMPFPYVAYQSGTDTTPVTPKLQATYVDQFGGQAEYEVLSDLSLGVEYNGRRQGQVIEDMSSDNGNTYYIANPGYGKPFTAGGITYDPKNAVADDPATARLVANGNGLSVTFPKPERSYDAVTLFLRKNFSRGWQGSASYTYSALRGNLAGPYRPETGQLDPGATSEYDLPTLMSTRTGFLPGDSTHQIKLFGSYTYTFSPRFNATLGASYTGASGNPLSVLGGYNDNYADGEMFIIQRGMAGRSPFTNRVDLRGGLEYVIRAPYALHFSVDVFNVLNDQAIVTLDENYTYDYVQSVNGLKCTSKAAGAGNPVATVQAACPDLKYLKTMDGHAVKTNDSFGKAAAGTESFQAPLSVRFGVALSF